MLADVRLRPPFSQPAADEEEPKRGVVLEANGGVEQRFQRVRGAVIAAVHDDEFVREPMLGAEWVLLGRHAFRCVLRAATAA